jgi:hypothetical protein
VREDFSWSSFYIKNYHDFITQELNNLGVQIEIPEDFDRFNSEEKSQYFEKNYYSNMQLFFDNKDKIQKYAAIFIDEIQDYQKEWVDIIREYFLDENGEFVVFGDEKQNVYERVMAADKKPYTSIPRRWYEFKDTFRLSSQLSTLATNFQNQFFQNKYELESVKTLHQQGSLVLEENKENIIEYISINQMSYQQIYNLINERANKYMIHPNDICIQSSRIDTLREINFYVTQTQGIKTSTTFETMEVYYLIILQILESFQENIQNQQESNYYINQIKQYKVKIEELKQLFNINNNVNINQSINYYCIIILFLQGSSVSTK